MPDETVEIHLRYEGPDVEDGSMSLADVVPVLQGFSSAYGKLASTADPGGSHRLRIVGVRQGSTDIVLNVWNFLGENVDQIASLGVVGGGAMYIVSKIRGVIGVKKHVKREPFKESVAEAHNSIVITNSENVTLEVPLEVYELFKSGQIDRDLNRMTSPLVRGRIEAAELEAIAPDGEVLRERIEVSERPYFEVDEMSITSTRETWLMAQLNSLTKSTNSGYLHLTDGTRVFYRYTGEDELRLHQIFGTYSGPVRIKCEAHMDENLKVTSLDVHQIEKTQGELFDPES